MKSFRSFYYGSVRFNKTRDKLYESGVKFSFGYYSYRGATRVIIVTTCKKGKRILESVK